MFDFNFWPPFRTYLEAGFERRENVRYPEIREAVNGAERERGELSTVIFAIRSLPLGESERFVHPRIMPCNLTWSLVRVLPFRAKGVRIPFSIPLPE